MTGKIKIENKTTQTAIIDIEGTIGVDEQWQFEKTKKKIATYQTFSKALEDINNDKIKNIIVNIRSTGGNVNDAILIYEDLIRTNKNITTKCFGYVASAATIIAQAASKGQREISGNALYLIHNSMCTTEGNAKEMARSLEMLDKTDERIAQIYADRGSKKVQAFKKLMNENNGTGRWLSPKEVLEYGLADKIIEAQPIEEDAAKIISNLGLPPIPQQNNKNIIMSISRHWKTILNILGIAEEKTEQPEEIEMRENKHENTTEKSTANESGINTTMQEYMKEIDELKNTVSTLEIENARLAAQPTITKQIEDPSINDPKRNPNDQAYINDIQNFK